MNTKLIEFLNIENWSLRGILTLPDDKIKATVVCLHGFERCSTTEKKFKLLADKLATDGVASLRFDFSGCGLSDGDFKSTTIEKQGSEFLLALEALERATGGAKISVIAHSLGACILASQIKIVQDKIQKIVLLAPALNQKELMRYWFVSGQMSKTNPGIEINWGNYKDYLVEEKFLEDCQKTNKMTKANYIEPAYFLAGKDIDYSNAFADLALPILHIHGDKDTSVPLSSLNAKFKNQILITGGDHDLEKPNQMEQWLGRAVAFITRS